MKIAFFIEGVSEGSKTGLHALSIQSKKFIVLYKTTDCRNILTCFFILIFNQLEITHKNPVTFDAGFYVKSKNLKK
jgi:hypothetical protein